MAEKQTMLMPEAELEPRDSDVLIPIDIYLRISLFKQLKSSPGVERLPGTLVLRHFEEGEVICRQGEAGWTAFYVLTSDDVAAVKEGLIAPTTNPATKRALSGEVEQWRRRADDIRRHEAQRAGAEAADGASHDQSDPARCIHVYLAIPRPATARTSWLRRLFGQAAPPKSLHPRFIPIDAPTDIDYETRQAFIREGELFGEMSCLNRSPRSATVVAGRECYVLEMLRNIFEKIKEDANYKKRAEEGYRQRVLDQQLRNIPLFADLSSEQFRLIRQRAKLASYKNGQIICDEHDRAEDAFIIRNGVVKVIKGDSALLSVDDLADWIALIAALKEAESPTASVVHALWQKLPDRTKQIVSTAADGSGVSAELRQEIAHGLNVAIKGTSLHSDKTFAGPAATPAVVAELARLPKNMKEWTQRDQRRLNRRVVEATLPGLKPLGPADKVETILAYRARGELIGEIGILLQIPRTATCTAYIRPTTQKGPRQDLEAVELVHLPSELFEELKNDEKFRAKVNHIAEERRRSDVRTLTAPVAAASAAVQLTDRFEELGLIQGQRLMLIDLDRCTRCDECVRACVNTHADRRSRLFLDGPRFGQFLVPTTCRSCLDPVCMIGCPVGSIHRGSNAEIVIEDWCIGCEMCAKQCPYGAIQMHDVGILPEAAFGWRVCPAGDLSSDDWTSLRYRDGHWRSAKAPFEAHGDLMAGLPSETGHCFRFEFTLPRDQWGEKDEYKLEMTAPPNGEAGLWLNGRPLTPHENKKDKRTYRLSNSQELLHPGRNVAAARVKPPAGYDGTIFDLRVDPVNKPRVGQLNPAEYVEKAVTHSAVVCDLCSTLPGKVPACVNACPHDAALRVNARSEFPVR